VPTQTEHIAHQVAGSARPAGCPIALLTGGVDRQYAYGLAMALVSSGIRVEVVGGDSIDSPEMHTTSDLEFVNLWPSRENKATLMSKIWRTARDYASLVRYAAVAKPRVFHILWNRKIEFVDRVLLMLYYKLLGKKIVLTVHNVNQARRDGRDSWVNRLTLGIQYRYSDHLFVHTNKMKEELIEDFGADERRITVIRYPLNNALPDTDLTPAEAKLGLGFKEHEKVILFLGKIKPYKGIEHLLTAFHKLVSGDDSYRLVVAGEVQKGNESYMKSLEEKICGQDRNKILLRKEYIPDEEMEIYLKAGDVLVLPYNEIFQSGVLFLSYSFGLPVIVTDVGSFREEIVEGKTGYLCPPGDPVAMARTIEYYFESDLYRNLGTRRQEIKEYAEMNHSWGAVADQTRSAYAALLVSLPS
jgi:glycosyltransferase involved in cell wall biosynthesis